jgi:hypothetical protein
MSWGYQRSNQINGEETVEEQLKASMSKKEFDEAFQSLVEDGLLVPTGELRKGRDGKLHPVYVADVHAKHYGTASAIADKKRRRIS